MSKKNRIRLSLITLGTTGIAVAGAIGGTLASISQSTTIANDTTSNPGTSTDTTTGNNNNNNGNSNSGSTSTNNTDITFKQNNGIVSGQNLAFAAVLNSDMISGNSTRQASVETVSSTSTKDVDLGEKSITPKYTSGWVQRTMIDGTKETRYQSPEYYNNRTFMPILDQNGAAVNERTDEDCRLNLYAGWDKTDENKTSYTLSIYKATDLLKETYPSAQEYVRAINYSFYNNNNESAYAKLTDAINKERADFVILTIDDKTDLSKINIPSSVKKLTIKSNYATSIDGLNIPKGVQEVEFYLGSKVTTVDPLMFPEGCNVITDTSINSSTIFKEVKISKANSDMTNKSQKLQNALNNIYQYRTHERAFQGTFSGGYIGSWDLTNTKVTSFNGVTVPLLNDGSGRFYVAHVEIKTDGNIDPSINESIDSDSVSNDSQIDSWFDWGQGWQKVQEVKVTSTKEISIDVAAKEIVGFMKKYPNIVIIDLSGIQLKDGKTADDLADAVKKLIPQEFGSESDKLNIQLKTNSTQLLD